VKTESETFAAPWPAVLAEMKDFLDLWFLVRASARRPSAVRIFISKALVGEAQLQPHVRRFRASLAGIRDCRIELKATGEAAHRIDIEYGR
jgi:hypothetical protein